ncbi:MAG: hypothetical protein ACP5H7_01135 [Minisyncoccia bacterium]
MNKFLPSIFLLLFCLPLFILAQPVEVPERCRLQYEWSSVASTCWQGAVISANETDRAICCLLDSVKRTTNWIFYILTIIVVVMAIWGAATIITSAGNPDSMTKGKQILTYALIGLVLALVAKLLPSIVQFIVIKQG